MTTDEAVVLLTLIAVIAAIAANAVQYYLTREQMKVSLFADYTKRYQEVILNLPEHVHEADFTYDALSPEERERTLRYMRVYYDLCSEEYFLHTRKQIDTWVWNDWERGMTSSFQKPAFRDAWEKICADTDFYEEFCAFANGKMGRK